MIEARDTYYTCKGFNGTNDVYSRTNDDLFRTRLSQDESVDRIGERIRTTTKNRGSDGFVYGKQARPVFTSPPKTYESGHLCSQPVSHCSMPSFIPRTLAHARLESKTTKTRNRHAYVHTCFSVRGGFQSCIWKKPSRLMQKGNEINAVQNWRDRRLVAVENDESDDERKPQKERHEQKQSFLLSLAVCILLFFHFPGS